LILLRSLVLVVCMAIFFIPGTNGHAFLVHLNPSWHILLYGFVVPFRVVLIRVLHLLEFLQDFHPPIYSNCPLKIEAE